MYGVGIGATAVVSLGLVAAASRQVLLDDLRNYLGRTAETLAAGIDGGDLAGFRDSSQTGSPEYQRASKPLRDILRVNPDIAFAYAGLIRSDSMYYLLDGDQGPDPAYVMEPDVPTAGELEMWRTGATVVERRLTTTAWGDGIRAYAPVRAAGGRMTGYIGVTIKAANYHRWVLRVGRMALVGAGVAVILAILGGLAAARTERARMAADAAIRRARELAEAAASAKSQFVANMSHEIRTPMHGVLGFTDLLSRTALNSTQRKYVDTMRTSAESLLVIINDILDFSKLEAGKMDLVRTSYSFAQVVEDAEALLRAQATAKGLELRTSYPGSIGKTNTGDPGRVRQVILNLLGNAIKFTQSGSVQVSVVRMPGAGGETIRVEVSDTGIGIPPGQLELIFDDFTQADGGSGRQQGGTGLGLSISKRLVTLMGGEIGVVSQPGVGSTFWFTIPADCEAVT